MFFRFSALAVLFITSVFAQAPAAPAEESAAFPAASSSVPQLQPDQNDPTVVLKRENVDRVRKLVSMGALPLIRLSRAQEDLQDALDASILKQSIYSKDLLPEQADQMVQVAQRMVFRRQRSLIQVQQLVESGVMSLAEAQATVGDLSQAKVDLDWAETRAELVRQMAENVRIEKEVASLESQAESHPDWAGKIYTHYDGNGIFTADERQQLESAWRAHFYRPLPISADGETAVHRSFGFDHRGRIDVAVTPDQPEGAWLLHYLESKRIPYFAFRSAVPHKATGAHIHVGPQSTKLALSD